MRRTLAAEWEADIEEWGLTNMQASAYLRRLSRYHAKLSIASAEKAARFGRMAFCLLAVSTVCQIACLILAVIS